MFKPIPCVSIAQKQHRKVPRLADTIQHFYPRLVELPQVRQAILDEFGEASPTILKAMSEGGSLDNHADDVEDLLVRLVAGNASILAEFEASGKTPGDPAVSTDYLRQHHPAAMALIERMGGAPGFEQSDFTVQVLKYEFLYVVAADGFDDVFFDGKEGALKFARSNYAPFIMLSS